MNDTNIAQSNEVVSNPSFRDRIATVDEKGKRKWIFAQKPKGRFYNIRSLVSYGFFILFFTLPFIKVNGRPLFLFNIPEAKFIIFGKIFWPQDFFIFGLAMVTFIVFIVLFTAAFGRLFCGWVCPQTIFMEMLFRKLEYWIEGDAAEQKLLQKSEWNATKIRKKLTKHLVFFLFAFVIANLFLSYIIGVDELQKIITEPVSQHFIGFLSIVVFSLVFYGVYAYFREQACTVVCPYGRLQSVLLDRNSMIVAYDYERGEPRGKYKKSEAPGTHGDCIDCFQCVKVCPTGIDIRNGTQMECVGCTACIDACDKMMDAIGKDRGLVRYASENNISNKQQLRFTGRMKFYSLVLVLLAGLLTTLLLTRKDVGATIDRAGGMLYQERGADSVSNLYVVKLVNKTLRDIPIILKVENAKGLIIKADGLDISVKKEAMQKASFFIVLPLSELKGRKTKLVVGVYEGDKKITDVKTNFLGPF